MKIQNHQLHIHAKCVELSKSAVYDVVKRFKEMLTVEKLLGSGRKPGPFDKYFDQKLRGSFSENPGLSDRDKENMEHLPSRFEKRD